jgi:hypothetical protein
MKRFAIALLFLLCVSPAFAALTKTETLVSDCKMWIQAADNGKSTYDSDAQGYAATRCTWFVVGFIEESAGELVFADDTHKKMSTGNWQDVTASQVIRVFVKYVTDNPDTLNKSAVAVLWLSAVKSRLYAYTPVPVQPVEH